MKWRMRWQLESSLCVLKQCRRGEEGRQVLAKSAVVPATTTPGSLPITPPREVVCFLCLFRDI